MSAGPGSPDEPWERPADWDNTEEPSRRALEARSRRGQRRAPRRSKWPIILAIVLGGFVLAALVAILAMPLLAVRSDGTDAKAHLTAAIDRLRDGDAAAAQEHVALARADVESATSELDGLRATIFEKVPIVGGVVTDLRHLVEALDDSVAVAETGVELYPRVLGPEAEVLRDGVVDLSVFSEVVAAADTVSDRLDDAHTSLDAIAATTPFVGETIGDARTEALDQVVRMQGTVELYQPLLDVAPTLLGTDAPKTYLVAVMNSSELRASGGATLSMGEMVVDQGRITFGESGNTTDFTDENAPISWEPVEGNPWHTGNPSRLVNATFSPNWTTSGEELLRAWEVTTGRAPDALIALDVSALADLFRITGPIPVEGYGQLTANNVVQKLIGNYDNFKNDEQRKRLNEAIIPVLRTKLLEGGKFVQKAQSLVTSAGGRHFVMYFRDPSVQTVATDLGLAGDLSDTDNDYIGVFTQNTNASKVDFWQQRDVQADVSLAADGSADVSLTVTVVNETPPYARQGEDPQRGYFTRYSIPLFVSYLPMGAELADLTVDGTPYTPELWTERDRTMVRAMLALAPDQTRTVVLHYRVPQAAVPDGAGLQYALDFDPQGMVNATALSVVLHLPEGYHEGAVDEELWTVNPDLTLSLATDDGRAIRTTVPIVPD